jgi:hypothetical protein
MNCREFLTRHSEYIDALIEPADAARLRSHVEACPSCARYDRVVRRGAQLARELLPRVEVSDDFEPRVRHRLLHVRDDMTRGRTGIAPTYTAAASVVLIVAAAAAALALVSPSVPVVGVAPVFATPPAATSLHEKAFATAKGPSLPFDRREQPSAFAALDPATNASDPHIASAAGWPVYSRSATAVAFPAPHTSLVVTPADFRQATTPRQAAGPLLVRH